MCRLLAVASTESTEFRFSLREAPRSLERLSEKHPDGWGMAVHRADRGWELHRRASHAGGDQRFAELAGSVRGELLIAHVRKRTVGPIGEQNTHPFRRGPWVFAHNGTLHDTAPLAAATSAQRRVEVEGDTDSERYFAFLLTALDEVGAGQGVSDVAAAERTLARCVRRIADRDLGAANFLLSDGKQLFAYRNGRSLYVLTRSKADPVRRQRRSSETHAQIETPWSARRHAVIIASERMTDEPFAEIAEGTLLRVDCTGSPRAGLVSAA